VIRKIKTDAVLILGNYAVFAASMIVGLVLVPVYVKYLGLENWGVIAWSSALMGVFAMLDLGLSQVMPRDLAQADFKVGQLKAAYLAYQKLYLTLAVLGLIIALVALPILLEHWFTRSNKMPKSNDFLVLSIGLLQAGIQLANMSNLGYFLGAGLQNLANQRILLFLLLRHIATLLSLATFGGSPINYVCPMCVVALIELGINGLKVRASLREIESPKGPLYPYPIPELIEKLRPVSIAVLLGLFVSQSDRVILSGLLNSTEFAQYTLVASVGLALVQLQNPIVKAFVRRFAHAAQGRESREILTKHFAATMLFVYIFPVCLMAIYAEELLVLWIPKLSSTFAGESLRLFCLAGILNAVYQFYYQTFLAENKSSNILYVNLISLIVVAAFWTLSWNNISMRSGAEAWAFLGGTQAAAAIALQQIFSVRAVMGKN
jgi:O-antigen/teichoic acid export membrane protein